MSEMSLVLVLAVVVIDLVMLVFRWYENRRSRSAGDHWLAGSLVVGLGTGASALENQIHKSDPLTWLDLGLAVFAISMLVSIACSLRATHISR